MLPEETIMDLEATDGSKQNIFEEGQPEEITNPWAITSLR